MLTFLKECDIISKLSTRDSENEIQVGMDCDEGPPVPIPNTEVKLIRADDTWLATARDNKFCQHFHESGYFA